jgi:hypothetical protein
MLHGCKQCDNASFSAPEWRGLRRGAREHWTEAEIDEDAFKDVRLGRRFAELLKQISDGMGGSIPFPCQDRASTKAAYRFFANGRVEEADILSGHFAATRSRYDDCTGPILLIQDTTEFSYQRADTNAIGITKSVNSGRAKAGACAITRSAEC